MEWIVCLGIIGVFIILFGIIFKLCDNDNGYWLVSYIFAFILFILITIIAYNVDNADNADNKPTVIDVYRGNITLEITYKDNISIDTVVVYKNK